MSSRTSLIPRTSQQTVLYNAKTTAPARVPHLWCLNLRPNFETVPRRIHRNDLRHRRTRQYVHPQGSCYAFHIPHLHCVSSRFIEPFPSYSRQTGTWGKWLHNCPNFPKERLEKSPFPCMVGRNLFEYIDCKKVRTRRADPPITFCNITIK
ncbi:hypothetical protein BC830DRAFT_1147830 [Chytriomyces sp. MP71]|nr:hypothetical protein BC830DRAFT_1147830 [Chytriomyces sp. MP71]